MARGNYKRAIESLALNDEPGSADALDAYAVAGYPSVLIARAALSGSK